MSDQVAAERFKVFRTLARGMSESPTGPGNITRARQIAESAKGVSQSDS